MITKEYKVFCCFFNFARKYAYTRTVKRDVLVQFIPINLVQELSKSVEICESCCEKTSLLRFLSTKACIRSRTGPLWQHYRGCVSDSLTRCPRTPSHARDEDSQCASPAAAAAAAVVDDTRCHNDRRQARATNQTSRESVEPRTPTWFTATHTKSQTTHTYTHK